MDDLVRDVGSWTIEKLTFLRKYLEAYVIATKSIPHTVDVCYMDIFSGPGRDRNRDNGEIVDGSPLIAMSLFPGFRRFIFIDLEAGNVHQLDKDAMSKGISNVTHIIEGDCNSVVDTALAHAPKDGATFCFIDPPGIDIKWDTIRTIARYKPVGRNKIELFILFAYNMDLVRFLTWERSPNEIWGPDSETRIDEAMPDSYPWRQIREDRNGGSISREETRRRFAYAYWMGLKQLGYNYVLNPRLLRSTKGRPLYYLFFASDHPVGDKIMADVLHKPISPKEFQLTLEFPDDLWVLEDPWDFKEGEPWYEEHMRRRRK